MNEKSVSLNLSLFLSLSLSLSLPLPPSLLILTSTRVFGDELERDLVNTPDLLDTFDRLDLPEWLEPTDAIDIIEEAERREASSTTLPMGVILTTVLDAARL